MWKGEHDIIRANYSPHEHNAGHGKAQADADSFTGQRGLR